MKHNLAVPDIFSMDMKMMNHSEKWTVRYRARLIIPMCYSPDLPDGQCFCKATEPFGYSTVINCLFTDR